MAMATCALTGAPAVADAAPICKMDDAFEHLTEAHKARGDGDLDLAVQKAARSRALATACKDSARHDDVTYVREEVESLLRKVQEDRHPGCGGVSSCLVLGVLMGAVTLSYAANPREGAIASRSFHFVLPAAGARFAMSPAYSVDLLVFTTVVDTDFERTNFDEQGAGCRSGDHAFEASLPCEGDALLQPKLSAGAFFTLGSDVGIVSPGLVVGVGRTTSEPTAAPYFGLMVSAGGLFRTFSSE